MHEGADAGDGGEQPGGDVEVAVGRRPQQVRGEERDGEQHALGGDRAGEREPRPGLRASRRAALLDEVQQGRADEEQQPEVIRALVQAGARIYQATRIERPLEEVYLELVRAPEGEAA